jgi:hypothetical protein
MQFLLRLRAKLALIAAFVFAVIVALMMTMGTADKAQTALASLTSNLLAPVLPAGAFLKGGP